MERKRLEKLHEMGWTKDDINKLISELEEMKLVKRVDNQMIEKEALHDKIKLVILKIGVPMHIQGFEFLIYAIEICVQDHTKLKQMMNKVYPMVAEKFNSKPICVERSMRYAIESVCGKGNKELMKSIFMNVHTSHLPCNSQFLATLVDYVEKIK